MPSWGQFWGQKCGTIKFESEEISITGDYCSKIEEKVRSFALREDEAIRKLRDRLSTRRSKTLLPWFRNRCDKHHYHCSSFSFVRKSTCFYTCFGILCYCFS